MTDPKTPLSKDPDQISRSLAQIVGKNRVRTSRETLFVYSQDMTENDPVIPDAVVMPENTEEVLKIVQWANETKIPLTPFVAGANVGGLSIPHEGGVIVDLKRMNRILEVDEENLYMKVEPGVTFGHVKAKLDRDHPHLRYAYPLSPPFTSVVANALLDGLTNMSNRHGSMAEWINTMEVVLPYGEVAVVGGGAVSPFWYARVPLPDMAGLFISWQGTTGIITKMSLQLYPKYEHRKRWFVLAYDVDAFFALIRKVVWADLFDDVAGFSWPAAKMMFAGNVKLSRQPDEPEFMTFLEMSAPTKKELRFKEGVFGGIMREFRKQKVGLETPFSVRDLVELQPQYEKLAEFPTTLDFLLDYGGGGFSWVGSYGPMSRSEEGTRRCFSVMEKHGFAPLLVTRPMRHGHFQVLRFITPFDKKNSEQVAAVKACVSEVAETLLDVGYVPYKAPKWAAEKILARADPGFVSLLRRIKSAVDPNRIMNPGNWTL